MKDLDELNGYLRECCCKDRSRRSRDSKSTIGERLQQDLQQAASLPKHRFDACLRKPTKVDKYQFARFDNVCYSVPRSCAFQISQGERMTAALLDRFTHHCEIFEMNGESYRFRESMKQKKQPRKKN